MKIGNSKYELNHIYNEDCLQAMKQILVLIVCHLILSLLGIAKAMASQWGGIK